MIRVRFYLKFNDCDGDYRPIRWPIKYPYWCTGETNDVFTIIAYTDSVEFDNEIDDYKLKEERK